MKKLITSFFALTLTCSYVWPNGQGDTGTADEFMEVTVLRIGLAHNEGHPLVDAWKDFGRILNEKSDGRYEVEFFLNGQLGDKQTHMTMMQTGSLDMWMIMGGFLGDYGTKLVEVMMLPYLFDNVAHARAVHQSDIGQKVLADIQSSGTKVVGIGMFQEASRNFFFTEAAVNSIEDMAGLKIRAQAGSIYEPLLESFGGSVVPVAFSELYSALQTGVVDGAEQPYSGYYSKKFYEVAPYFLLDGHETSPNYALFSEMSWNSISIEDQNLIKESMHKAIMNYNTVSTKIDEEIIRKMKDAGVVFTEPTDIDKWKAVAEPLYEEYAPGYGDIIEAIKNTKY